MALRRWSVLAAIAAVYFLAGKLGLQYFAYVHASASPVWPPAGIALTRQNVPTFARSGWCTDTVPVDTGVPVPWAPGWAAPAPWGKPGAGLGAGLAG